MLYDLDMSRRLAVRGYSVNVFGDMTARIYFGHRYVATVEGEWGLFNWMEELGMFEEAAV